jgi:hypothetical protein
MADAGDRASIALLPIVRRLEQSASHPRDCRTTSGRHARNRLICTRQLTNANEPEKRLSPDKELGPQALGR